jgi:hypothetical protein
MTCSTGQRLVENITPLFDNVVIEPCLLHGDLWGGNISSDKNREPVILDPACYCKSSVSNFSCVPNSNVDVYFLKISRENLDFTELLGAGYFSLGLLILEPNHNIFNCKRKMRELRGIIFSSDGSDLSNVTQHYKYCHHSSLEIAPAGNRFK